MRLIEIKKNIESDLEEFSDRVKNSHSIRELLFHYKLPENGKQIRYIKSLIKNLNLSVDHFNNIRIKSKCGMCESPIEVLPKILNKSKSGFCFCSQSCGAIYNNSHKTTGTRRSKLEVFIEDNLTLIFPNLEIHFNRRDTINGELDIYIPSLKLAFELNGIFHYEPIFSEKKLKGVQNNDQRKFQACLERGIELCVIDTHNVKYHKKERDKKFLDIIKNLIEVKINS